MKYILGIDIGTSNTKAVAYSYEGNALAQANSLYVFSSPEEGYHELDPRVLFEAVLEVIKSAVQQVSSAELTGISFSAAMHGLIAVDEKGMPLTNMITWADLRSNEYAKKLMHSSRGAKIYERTGTPIHPMSPLCKLMWMKDNLPEIFNNAYKFISIKEYVFFHFFEEFIIDNSLASATGLFDIYDLGWNGDALEEAGIKPGRLSRHVPATYIVKGIKTEYATLLGIDEQLPFVIGASDGCLSHIGSNALQNKDVSLTIGTSGAIRVMSDKPLNDVKQRIFNYLLTDNLYVAGGPINNGGNVLEWFAKGFLNKTSVDSEDYDEFIEQALQIPAGSEGLIFLPYIYGERAPVWNAEAKGVFFGVSSQHGKGHFMRAIMEGICFALYGILKSVEDIIGPVNKIYASGGFIKSDQWVSMMADVLGKKVFVTHSEDSSATGAAIIGMMALGIINDVNEVQSFFTVKESFQPDMDNHKVYLDNYAVYSGLYDKLK